MIACPSETNGNDIVVPATEVLASGGDQAPIARLVRQLRDAAPRFEQPPAGVDSIMLDVKVDGLRCLLIRMERVAGPSPLSPREREIARLVAKGCPNKVIAGVLQISCWTVGTHLRRIFTKLGVSSRAAMVDRLHDDGISNI
jgi:DNA-binding NarL/FixJ family response regulator